LSFDIRDPEASMSVAGSPVFSSFGFRPPTVRQTDLPDDRCICCAAGVTVRPVELRIAQATSGMDVPIVFLASGPQLDRIDPPPRA
jgi:hypothetical protein